ncbi:hypothetical protein ACTM9L_09160 [Citrobacter freundii]
MSKQNDGGPAFPHSARLVAPDTYEQLTHGGMSLRDYFAAKAMSSLCNSLTPEAAAKEAYEYADAMLLAKESS